MVNIPVLVVLNVICLHMNWMNLFIMGKSILRSSVQSKLPVLPASSTASPARLVDFSSRFWYTSVLEMRTDAKLLSIRQAALHLRRGRALIRRMIDLGQIKATRAGIKLWLIPRSEIERLLGEELREAGEAQQCSGDQQD